MNYYQTCPQCLHRELSDAYGGDDCPECGAPMSVNESPAVFIINGKNERVLVDADDVRSRHDPLAVVKIVDSKGVYCWSVTHVPTGIAVMINRGTKHWARTMKFARELSRVIHSRDLSAWFDCDPQAIVEETPRDVLDWIAANRDESATRYVPLRDAHARAELHRERVAYEAWVSSSSVRRAFFRDDNTGVCRSCGNEQSGCEPDAKRYRCEMCGEFAVYGAEQLIAMGLDADDQE